MPFFLSFADLALAFSQAPKLPIRYGWAIPRGCGGGGGGIPMEVYTKMKHVRLAATVLAVCLLVACQAVALAQNLGAAPQVNVAVQGQTGAQPEGAFLNFVNWAFRIATSVWRGTR